MMDGRYKIEQEEMSSQDGEMYDSDALEEQQQ